LHDLLWKDTGACWKVVDLHGAKVLKNDGMRACFGGVNFPQELLLFPGWI
jgi:hypothetical protein